MQLTDIDLNLLIVFQQLFTEKSVSAVAAQLGLTQPAVSNALARLRRLMNDELFLRTSRGMEPTPYAIELSEPIAYALGALHDALHRKTDFDPAASNRKFTVAMTDIGEIYFLPRLMTRLAQLAPAVTVSTVRNRETNLADALQAGHVDLALGLLPQLKSGFFQRGLFRQRYVCMFRQGHALDRDAISVDEFAAASHVVVVADGTGHATVDESIQRRGIARKVMLTVPHFVALGHILSSTDMVATVPERYAQACLAPFDLRYLTHPVPLPDIGINLFWHARFHKDPASIWLRNVVFDLFSDHAQS
jgi:DNA-binding transcriptional LysR family regulator